MRSVFDTECMRHYQQYLWHIVHMSTCSVTRARRSCLVIGDSGTLRQDECCSSLWQYCSTRGAVMSASRV